MKQNLLWTLKQLHLALEQYGRAQMEQLDLSPTQGAVLHHLLSQPGQAAYAVELHTVLGLSKSSISAALKSLKQKGYVRLTENPADDRKKRIVLTRRAYEAQREIDASLARQQDRLCQSIPREHLPWLEQDLARMLRNVQSQSKEDLI